MASMTVEEMDARVTVRYDAAFAKLASPVDRDAFNIVAAWPYDGPAGYGEDYAVEMLNDLHGNGYAVVKKATIDALVDALGRASTLGAFEREAEHGDASESEAAGEEITAIHAEIKAALALAKS